MSEKGGGAESGAPKEGKATELVRRISERTLTEEEMAARRPKVPELRLRPDAMVVVDDHTPARDLLDRLTTEGARSMKVEYGEGDSCTEAVLVPVDRYVHLVGINLATSGEVEALLDGRLVPSGLDQADVEPVDPNASWEHHPKS
jgi:hypothetical protein